MAVTPDGTRAYVTNNVGGTVSVIDTATNTVIDGPIDVGGLPLTVAVSPDGTRAYVANSPGTVSVINTANNKLVTTVKFSDNAIPLALAVSPYGPAAGNLYVATSSHRAP